MRSSSHLALGRAGPDVLGEGIRGSRPVKDEVMNGGKLSGCGLEPDDFAAARRHTQVSSANTVPTNARIGDLGRQARMIGNLRVLPLRAPGVRRSSG